MLKFFVFFFLLIPSYSQAGWIYLDPSLSSLIPPGGSILVRTYATDINGVTSPIYTDPILLDTDGSGIMINPNGGSVLLSNQTPYPVLTPQMTSFSSTPADQWFQQFDPVTAASMFSYAFLLIALSGAVAHGVGVMISMFGRR